MPAKATSFDAFPLSLIGDSGLFCATLKIEMALSHCGLPARYLPSGLRACPLLLPNSRLRTCPIFFFSIRFQTSRCCFFSSFRPRATNGLGVTGYSTRRRVDSTKSGPIAPSVGILKLSFAPAAAKLPVGAGSNAKVQFGFSAGGSPTVATGFSGAGFSGTGFAGRPSTTAGTGFVGVGAGVTGFISATAGGVGWTGSGFVGGSGCGVTEVPVGFPNGLAAVEGVGLPKGLVVVAGAAGVGVCVGLGAGATVVLPPVA